MLGRTSGLQILCLLLGLAFVDCAAIAAPSLGGPAPVNYRQIVSDGDAAKILRNVKSGDRNEAASALRIKPKTPATLSVSSLRKTIATEEGDWFTCLRAIRGGIASYYGISFVGSEIVEWRPAVVIDRCEQQTYELLPPPSRKGKGGAHDSNHQSGAANSTRR